VPRIENQRNQRIENQRNQSLESPNISLRKNPAKYVECKRTQSAQCRLVKTDTTEQFIASLEVEQQGYRHFPNTIAH